MYLKAAAGCLALALTLVACQTTQTAQDSMREKGHTPMTGPEIRAALDGNTLYLSGDIWEWWAIYKADGTMRGIAEFTGGTMTGTGSWSINQNGEFCRDWDNDWGGGGYGCQTWYRKGDKIAFAHASGSRGNNATGVFTILAGAPKAF